MKKKIIGLILLLIIMAAVGVIYLLKGNAPETVTVNGYVGGEKIEFLEDPEVQSILQDRYSLKADYAKAGSLDMMTADPDGMDYLFPSSSIAEEYYEDLHGKPLQSEIILNTPIVLYTHKSVLEAFDSQGLISENNGVYQIDMAGLVSLIQNDTTWADIGLNELYGNISVDTTDPAKSNSGNMFAALLANVLNGGQTLTEDNLRDILPELQSIFGKLGYMETSSSDLFSQFLRMGVGAKPIIAGYESQLIEYAAIYPDEYKNIADDIVMLRLLYGPPMCCSPWMRTGRSFWTLSLTRTSRALHGQSMVSAPEITVPPPPAGLLRPRALHLRSPRSLRFHPMM